MKKIFVSFICAAAALALTGCAKQAASGENDANKRYFDAWMSINHPGAVPTGLGIYIIEDEPGSGAEVKTEGFALIDYTTSDLEGNISSYSSQKTAEQLGEYDIANYYGPKFQSTIKGTLPAGVQEALVGMQVGGHRKVIVPSWLMTYSTYETEEDYLEKESSNESTIYDITVKDFTEDVIEWQIGKIEDYFVANNDIFEGMSTARDTIPGHKGFYYKELAAPTDTTSFSKDTTIYINYTGRLLSGKVFDTTNERLAKDSGIWSSSRTYEPVEINWGEEYTDITMGSGSSSVIGGFALTLWQMRAFEKGIGVFTSEYGYGFSGSGKSIPAYSPLIFEIEIVSKPDAED